MTLTRSEAFVFPFHGGSRSWGKKHSLLVVAAHPDDECAGAATALLRCGRAAVVFLTDGTPGHPGWMSAGRSWTHSLYRQVRRREAKRALRLMGVASRRLLFSGIPDQELAARLREGGELLRRAVLRFRPALLLVPAYEGGHPDHDAASFLVSHLLRSNRLLPRPRVVEYALYSAPEAKLQTHWLPGRQGSVRPRLGHREQRRRRLALRCYASQAGTLRWLGRLPECFGPLPAHDFGRPPGAVPVYELWGMHWTAARLCDAFTEYSQASGCGL